MEVEMEVGAKEQGAKEQGAKEQGAKKRAKTFKRNYQSY